MSLDLNRGCKNKRCEHNSNYNTKLKNNGLCQRETGPLGCLKWICNASCGRVGKFKRKDDKWLR